MRTTEEQLYQACASLLGAQMLTALWKKSTLIHSNYFKWLEDFRLTRHICFLLPSFISFFKSAGIPWKYASDSLWKNDRLIL